MAEKIALKSLHLEYRLWIAELNFDITLIRILNDRLSEILAGGKDESKKEAGVFEKKFSVMRQSIDGLSHRMQIEKMNLAADVRKNAAPDYQIIIPENHSGIRNDFFNFRVLFNELKSDFLHFEDKS